MPSALSAELLTAFRNMAQVIYAGDSYESVYDALCNTAVELIDGCDHASLMVQRSGRIFTAAASDDVAKHIDDLERELGEGPCLEAIDESEEDQHLCSDLTTGSQWPRLAARILAETDVKGMAGFRLHQDGRKVAALNVFSDTAGGLDGAALDQASMLSAFASVTLAALDRGEEASTLRRGLESNREIGKAIGLLMAMHKIGDDQAFEMLAKVSQEMNIKVADVAAQVIAHHRKGDV